MIFLTQTTEDAPKPEKKGKKKHRRPILIAIISLLLSLIMAATLLIAIPITFFRFLLTDHNIEVIVDHAIDSIEFEKIEIRTESGSKSISELILDYTAEVEELDFITEELINQVLLNDFAKHFITDLLKQYGFSLTGGKDLPDLTAEEIYSIIEENIDTVEQFAREAGYEGEILLQENKEKIVSVIESAIGKEGISTEFFLESSNEGAKLAEYLRKAQLFFSDSTLLLVWGTVAFIALLLLFLNIKFLGSFCRACGFPAFIVGGLYTIAAFAAQTLIAMITIENEMLAELVRFTVGFVAALLADIALPAVITGLVLIIVSFVLDILRKILKKA